MLIMMIDNELANMCQSWKENPTAIKLRLNYTYAKRTNERQANVKCHVHNQRHNKNEPTKVKITPIYNLHF